MISFVKQTLKRLKTGTEAENYGRHVLVRFGRDYIAAHPGQIIRVLDLGLGSGQDIAALQQACPKVSFEFYGVDTAAEHVQAARSMPVTVTALDIETEALPFADAFFDIVIANQVLEHTKELFHISSEVARVLKPEGQWFIGVPNLAAWHNRAALLVGEQPTCIEPLSAHVRGFTKKGLIRFLETEHFFKFTAFGGSNFYPFPKQVARLFAKVWPGGAVGLFLCLTRTQKQGQFSAVLDTLALETPYRK